MRRLKSSLVPFAEWPQAQYWWQPSLVCSMASPLQVQVQHRQLLTMDFFVAPDT